MAQAIALSEFMKYLVSLISDDNIAMPLKDEHQWHALFYRLKKDDLGAAKPPFLARLRFDWDGPYPKCREISDLLHAMHWNAGLDADNPHYTTISLPKPLADFWRAGRSKLDKGAMTFLECAKALASAEFKE